jgi:NAD(P)-dependent dehydrogenase (short-subunit alcohol dehydrogenase family)
MQDLAGKTVFITGGASGLGLGMARAFAEAGMKLVLTDIDEAAVQAASAELSQRGAETLPLQLDVCDRPRWEECAKEAESRFGPVHVLCNNAGIMAMGWEIDQIPIDLWDLVLRVNLTGAFYGAHVFVPRMKAHGQGGHIVNTASMSGLRFLPAHAVYSAAKAGMIAMSETVRMELERHGIGVTILCPGPVRTRLLHNSIKIRADVESAPPPGPEADVSAIPEALDPLDFGRAALRAIRENRLYAVTHPENRKAIEERHERLMEAFAQTEQ